MTDLLFDRSRWPNAWGMWVARPKRSFSRWAPRRDAVESDPHLRAGRERSLQHHRLVFYVRNHPVAS